MNKPKIGDIVVPTSTTHPFFYSGCSRYADVVVVSVEPFALVSRECDMM